MTALLAIARNTFREAVRDRVLYLFLGFAIVVLVATKLFGMLTVGDEAKVVKDLGLFGIQFFGMLIAVMMSVLLISREVEHRTVYTVLSRPVTRSQFLLGKYLGLLATVAVNVVLMAVTLLGVVVATTGELDPGLLFAATMTLLEMALVAAFATLFAVLSKPILGALLTLTVFVVGHVTEHLWVLTEHVRAGWSEPLVAAVYYLLPNLERFNFKTEVVHDLTIPADAVGWAVVYGLAYTTLVLVLACLHLRRRDLV